MFFFHIENVDSSTITSLAASNIYHECPIKSTLKESTHIEIQEAPLLTLVEDSSNNNHNEGRSIASVKDDTSRIDEATVREENYNSEEEFGDTTKGKKRIKLEEVLEEDAPPVPASYSPTSPSSYVPTSLNFASASEPYSP